MNSTIIGRVLDNYRILQNIGRGGMGFVFKALNIKLNKIVAIKMIAPALAMNDSFMSRFEAEAKTLAKLENPNIVGIHDLRVDSDYAYIVMEYVEGITLGRLIKEKGPIPWRQALKLFNQMLNAIDHAHKEGIIHRDIKPNNVLINRQGIVKITDFGLAKNQAEFGITQSVTTGGTLFYMSPEQVRGLAYTDERSDIYALGFTLYEMLTGVTPFSTDHTDFDIREAIIRTKFPPPHQMNKNIPAKLGRIVDTAISKNPDDRYQSVNEFQTAIEAFYQKEEDKRKKTGVTDKADPITEPFAPTESNHVQEKKPQIHEKVLKNTVHPGGKFYHKVIYASAASLVLVLILLKLTGFLDYPSAGDANNAGLISITSIPNHSLVFINGDSVGQTPLDKYKVNSKSANVLIIKDDYFSIDTTVQINKEKDQRLDVEMRPAARISFEIEPADADLLIDSKLLPLEKRESVLLPVGDHKLEIRSEGQPKYVNTFTASKGNNNPIQINLSNKNGETSQEASRFTINSVPSGASVYLDNEFAGKTPFQSTNLEEKSYALRLSKPGYKDLRDQFTVNRDRNGRIIRTLEKITGAIELISNPPGAAVRLNGKPVEGLTPLVLNAVPAGKNSLTLSKDGYADQSAEIVIEAENTKKITMELQRQMGSLSILVIPWGNIFIDQQLFKKEAQFRQKIDLGAGLHQLRVEHPTLGAYDKLIRVENDKITDVEVNFNKTHTVRVMAIDAQGSDINADILVDGKRTGERTPINLNLKTGTYTISVSRTGYMLADGPKIVTVDETIRKPLNFVLKKTNE